MGEKKSLLTKVEAELVTYFVWREMNDLQGWFKLGIKELATRINRTEKSVRNAIKSLNAKGKLTREKRGKKIWVKHTLSDDELYSRIAFLDPKFANTKSIQELKQDLINEITHLEKELAELKIRNSLQKAKDKAIDFVKESVTEEEIYELIRNFNQKTYVNSNYSNDQIIESALKQFRKEQFAKQEEVINSEFIEEEESDRDFYKDFFSITNDNDLGDY